MRQIKKIIIALLIFVIFSTAVAENRQTAMTAILGALDVELELIKKETTNKKTIIVSGLTFTTGKLRNHNIVFARTGVGKVNAAMTTAAYLI